MGGADTQLTQGKEITSHIEFFKNFSGETELPINRQKRTFRFDRPRAAMCPKRTSSAGDTRKSAQSYVTDNLSNTFEYHTKG